MITARLWQGVRRVLAALWLALRWTVRAWRWIAATLFVGGVVGLLGHNGLSVALYWSVPAWNLVRAFWAVFSPMTYEPLLGGPLRRHRWRRYVRRRWPSMAESCGLADRVVRENRTVPRLLRVRARDNTLTIRVRARSGQTLDDLRGAVEAVGHREHDVEHTGSHATARGRLGAHDRADLLDQPLYATIPNDVDPTGVQLGRIQDGNRWRLTLRGLQTLVVGCSGSGKGSVFWGIAGNLAPAVEARLVRLWGIDLKGGIEIGMGDRLFYRVSTDEHQAVDALRDLLAVVDQRQRAMYGRTRDFVPTPGDPVHVLLIDELAVLTAYASKQVQSEASDLLRRVLTQGRALGVLVVAFVQDPRKETVAMRGLFTQTVALRLRSASETVMVLGEGMAEVAPAHQISPAHPGTGYVVADDGNVERVRADFWEDTFIRMVAENYPAPDRYVPPPIFVGPPTPNADDKATTPTRVPAEEQRAPRAPRKRRSPRKPRESATRTASPAEAPDA